MISRGDSTRTGILLSGGLDSCILAGHLVEQGHQVQPFYIRSRLYWEEAEYAAACRFLKALGSPLLDDLVTLEVPIADVYQDHWSITGLGVPGVDSPDEAVFLPGRNALLLIKAAIWCQLNGIQRLALAALGTSPFADASAAFFEPFETALNCALATTLEVARPFASLDKRQVMRLGQRFPLQHTFSCIAPSNNLHCGACNKCAERRAAFRSLGVADPTRYDSLAAEAAP